MATDNVPENFYSVLQDLLKQRTQKAWEKICKHMDRMPIESWQLTASLALIKDTVKTWPPNVSRPALKTWGVGDPRIAVCRLVRETATYGDYINAICMLCTCDPTVRCIYTPRPRTCLRCQAGGLDVRGLPDLRTLLDYPACSLERQFTGKVQTANGRDAKIGISGSADLKGGLILSWLGRKSQVLSVEQRLEVEIKTEKGREEDEQVDRQRAFASRHGLYIFARTLSKAILSLHEYKVQKELELAS